MYAGPFFATGNVGDRPGCNLCEGALAPAKKMFFKTTVFYITLISMLSSWSERWGALICNINFLLRYVHVCVKKDTGMGGAGGGDIVMPVRL